MQLERARRHEALADAVVRRLARADAKVNAYWMRVSGDRSWSAAAIETRLSDAPVVVAILRDVRFTNPNALLADFVELVEEHRALS